MKALLHLCCALALLPFAHAADPAKGFEKYAFIRTRNVFDPDRRPVAPTAAAPVRTSNRPSAVVLTGTMATDGKTFAFFNSARAEYNKVVPVNESVAGFKVKSISSGMIEVEADGKTQVLTVGEGLPIAGAEAPSAEPVAPAADAPAVPADPNAPATAPVAAPAAAPAANPAADILKRMLERRQKEMSR